MEGGLLKDHGERVSGQWGTLPSRHSCGAIARSSSSGLLRRDPRGRSHATVLQLIGAQGAIMVGRGGAHGISPGRAVASDAQAPRSGHSAPANALFQRAKPACSRKRSTAPTAQLRRTAHRCSRDSTPEHAARLEHAPCRAPRRRVPHELERLQARDGVKRAVGKGQASASVRNSATRRIPGGRLAWASIGAERSTPTTVLSRPLAQQCQRQPVPVATSSTHGEGILWASAVGCPAAASRGCIAF